MKERQHTQAFPRSQSSRPDDCVSIQSSNHTLLDPAEAELPENGQTDTYRHVGVPAKHSSFLDIKADYRQSRSIEEAHWALLLNEVAEVRSYLSSQQKKYDERSEEMSQSLKLRSHDPGSTLLFGSARNMSRAEILAQLPSRYSCDKFVARYFSRLSPAIYILHKATFMKQYERFWLEKASASGMWLALLFAMMRIAALDYLREDDEPIEYRGSCQDLANSFRSHSSSCLILADYLRPQEFTLEVLILHLYAEYLSSRDAKSSTWVLSGMIVRLAMRMGYHQPSQPNLSQTVFQVEMRRRCWAFIRQADILLSFQAGLPSMIKLQDHDDSLPRNICDDNFNEDCTILPVALADSEPTQISFLIAKSKLAFGFARALKEIDRSNTMSWQRLLEIDRDLRRIYHGIPEIYKLGQLQGRDSLVLISARFNLASIHHKSICVVHSRFLDIGKSDPRYSYSRRACLSSAMALLRFQDIQNQDVPIEGGIRSMTNYQTSFAIHDYLLAATILSADLCSGTSLSSTTNQSATQPSPSKVEMVKALKTCARIFRQVQDWSMEAFKAADVLEMLVQKFEARDVIVRQSSKKSPSWNSHSGFGLRIQDHHEPTSNTVTITAKQPLLFSESVGGISDPVYPTPQEPCHGPSPRHHFMGNASPAPHITSTDETGVESLPIWPGDRGNDACFHSSINTQLFPEPEMSWDSTTSGLNGSTQSALGDGTGDDDPASFPDPASFSTPFNLNDPFATLWDLNLATY
ncbi:hypothetical protein PV10_09071 [Exophiala mesophila]|uniref:Xylanolytic transcriptional activator regulatory domain-containing protein n=1 Tax=Exophiala mesophila TaxID=212818 RepID=A0A0D1YZW9_EXOME|nr:uncharacterized protein PV10_09071 [Exophiala mesophila]KIV88147.1 hypothetical protein PV10_09071 [Exophiala mesophila]